MKRALVAGASGLVGMSLIRQLEEHPDFSEIICVVRKPGMLNGNKIREVVIDFNQLPAGLEGIVTDASFCCLGTTIRTAGSKQQQYKVDHDYVVGFAAACRQNGIPFFAVVSSIGAKSSSANFYLRTKGEMERDCLQLEFPNTLIVRPSVLLGDRKEFRLTEKAGAVFLKIFSFLLIGKWRKYKGIHVDRIAARMIAQSVLTDAAAVTLLESDQL